jgi:putative DNA primase/helicase
MRLSLPDLQAVLITNHAPIIKGDEQAIWRRIRLIPFEVTIPEHQRDPRFMETLKAELPDILNWTLEGCLAWQREGLAPPPRVVVATEVYRADMDWFSDWLVECCDTGHRVADAITPTGYLYASYEHWAKGCGLRVMSKHAFSRKLEARGFERVRSAKARGFRGIAVRPIEPMSPGDMKHSTFIGSEPMTDAPPETMDGSIESEDSFTH